MERKWWHEKIAYQIYPKSFKDSNGDGIGDIRGIIGKLDYLQDLGIEILWISPMYCSPLADEGYDISDYYNIDPRFGSMSDMDELIAEAKKRGIHILMDLVVNHCSDEHIWFKKACEEPDGKYGRYFYIKDWHKGEKLPCNLRSYFGGSCWDMLPGHEDKIYFHSFHKKQPDLNWENKEVREEVYRMVNWWLDKGIAGFRIDAIINIKKKLPFRDYPVDRTDGYSTIINMIQETDGVDVFLNELADETFRKHDALTVGEVFNNKPEELPMFIGEKGVFSSMFDFNETVLSGHYGGWHTAIDVTPEMYKKAVFDIQKSCEGVGMISNIIENHDQPRGVSHYIPKGECCTQAKKMLGGLNFMLKGLPFIYQGQEIGMENFSYDSIDEADDVEAINNYQVALDAGLSPEEALDKINHFTRDNARSPYQWDDSEYAGFSKAKPWMKVNPNFTEINLASQICDEDSVYAFYKKLIALRKNPVYKEKIVYGETIPYLMDEENLMAYFRGADRKLLVIGNFQKDARTVALPGAVKNTLLNNISDCCIDGEAINMKGYQFLVLELE